ncbi:Poly(A) RNA polymerase protein cid1 [Pleurostoma richardsiae]|uniref:Poly(A) RNA polymerase protein cid1 n=1 Tax=Pleurostoma richardsiae TaxID=41990 RepID=A0AA38VFG1_9PEZI|nr:Poly(A) RNA polymerase protein cid1 [Pleurostoma richardsiae]
MDLGLLSPLSKPQPESQESPIPRLVEKAFLDMGYGARLLTKTRVPIIKLCEKPPEKLRQGLLEERAKWEKGVDDDREPEDGEANDDALASPTFETRPPEESGQGHKSKPSGGVGPHAELDPEQLLGTLRQSNNVQLSSYYSMAKRVLRKLGGRDITHSTFADFGPNDFKVLNDVCHAFVRGLADKALRARLEKYKSLSFSDVQTAPSSPANRSLAGVYTQIEGELMAMAWESRQIHEKDDHLEKLAQSRLSNWKTLQDKPTYGLDPLAYNKELHFIADQLRKVPSIDLMLFQQRQYESASQYHSRAVKILLDLGGHDTTSKSSPVLPAVVSQYVSGISKEDVRTEVAEFSKSIGGNSLRAVARKHKALQLAKEFEKALQRELYRDEDVGYIEKYIHVLRGSMKKTMTGDHHFDYVVPITGQMMGLLEIIKGLPDPSQMAPNQPRDPYRDRLEFPKTGAGVQCDINFSAHLALHNTLLLRCYSHADPRVRPLVLFVKHWAKVRGINTPYRGTLSSYGYVLMMLHYLVNVAQPFVCPNLQELAPPLDPKDTPQQVDDTVMCKGRDVRFWRDEAEISRLARSGVLTLNRDSIGVLLRGFFEYYAQNGTMSTAPIRGFDWGRDVLSLRTHGGLLSKQDKGWTGAKTVFEVQNKRASTPTSASEPQLMQANPLSPTDPITEAPQTPSSDALQSPGVVTKTAHEPARGGDVKEIRHRYLFAIEDPFETDHNVARTVTHNGIVAIRDEFRRAWRIIRNAGKGTAQEDLLQAIGTEQSPRDMYSELLTEIHGRELFGDAN